MPPQLTVTYDSFYAQCPEGQEPWRCWPVPAMPPIGTPWSGVADTDAPWRLPIDQLPVDTRRTERLSECDVYIHNEAGRAPFAGVSWGSPFNVVSVKDSPKVKVWNLGEAPVWSFSWLKGIVRKDPVYSIPMPSDRVRREGDPVGASDQHAYFIDPSADGQMLYEVIQLTNTPLNGFRTFGTTTWCAGYDGGKGVAVWDMRTPFKVQKTRGVVASAVPHFPMIVRWEEVAAGRIDHAIFVTTPGMAEREWTGFARATDGHLPGFPLRAGERLRLKPEVRERIVATYGPRHPRSVVAVAMATYGIFIGDTTYRGPNAGKPFVFRASAAYTQDRRFSLGEGTIPPLGDWSEELKYTDFEVVSQTQ